MEVSLPLLPKVAMSHLLVVMADEELFSLVKEGDEQAFAVLYERYLNSVMVFTLKRVGASVAEDIVHDLFARLWDRRSSIELRGKFISYLFRSLRNSLIDFMAKSDVEQRYQDSIESFAENYVFRGTDYNLRQEHFMTHIERLLQKHSPNAYRIILLRMEGYSNQEIAKELGLSEKTIRNQHSAILKYLRYRLILFYLFLFF